MLNRFHKLTIVGCVLAFATIAVTSQAQTKTVAKDLMKLKLQSAQLTLEALALEDYEALGRHAQQLHLISQETGWNLIQTKQYQLHSSQFRRTAQRIVNAAKRKNLDAASLAYVQLTLSCIECHKHVRQNRRSPQSEDKDRE